MAGCDPVHYELKGQIRSQNRGIQNANVTLDCSSLLPSTKTTTTNEKGNFTLTGIGVINKCLLKVEQPGYVYKEISISNKDIIDSTYPLSPVYVIDILLNQEQEL